MNLLKAKFKIIKIEGCEDLGSDPLEIFHIVPETEHLSNLGSGQYSLEEGRSFGCTEDEEVDRLEKLLSELNEAGSDIEEGYKKLKEEGFVDLGINTNIQVFKKIKRQSEYILGLVLDEDRIIVIATSSNKRILQQYKKLLDNDMTRFKLKLILDKDPNIIGSLKEIKELAREDALICREVLNQMKLT